MATIQRILRFYHLRLSVRSILRFLLQNIIQVGRIPWLLIRRLSTNRNAKPLSLKQNHGRTQMLMPILGMPTSKLTQLTKPSCYGLGLHEPFGSVRSLELQPYMTSPENISDVEPLVNALSHPPDEPRISVSQETELTTVDPHLLRASRSGLPSSSTHSSPRSALSPEPDPNPSDTDTLVHPPLINDSRTSVVIQPEPERRSIQSKAPNESMSEIARHIYCLIPSELKRYERIRPMPYNNNNIEIQANTTSFSSGVFPGGWIQHIHPEGRPTFYNAAKRIITESWILDDEIYQCLTSSFDQIENFRRTHRFEFPRDCDLVLDVEERLEDGDQYLCGYYYVAHSSRSIFWLEGRPFIDGVATEARLRTQMEYQYWYHWALFPNVNQVTLPILDMITNHIRDVRTDLLTSRGRTTLSFNLEEVNNCESIVRGARKQLVHGRLPPTSWFVGKFMSFLCDVRFRNFYGDYGARLSRTQSVYGPRNRSRSYLIKILSPILFSAPDDHLKTMDDLWIGDCDCALDRDVLKFINKLVEEWIGHALYASILLTVNVAFLAIPSNDPGYDVQRVRRSPTQIASYLSIVNSAASMLLALLLIRQNKTEKAEEPLVGKGRALEALAILYSLPYVLLVWSLVMFFAAFFLMCFQQSDAVTRSLVGTDCILAAIMIVWCIWIGWKTSENYRWPTPLYRTLYQWRRKIWRRKSDRDGRTPKKLDSSNLSDWTRLRQLGRRTHTSPSDVEHLPVP